MIKIDAQNVDFYCGDFPCVEEHFDADRSQHLGSLYRPVGVWKVYLPPTVQPHERPDPRHASGREDIHRRTGHIQQGGKSRYAPQKCRNGISEAEPVPVDDLRKCGLRPSCKRH